GVRCAEALRDCRAQSEGGERPAGAEGVDLDSGGLEGPGLQLPVEPELVEHAAGIGADLQAGADFLYGLVALEQDDGRAELRECQRKGQPGDSCTRNVDSAPGAGHGALCGLGLVDGRQRLGGTRGEIRVEYVERR